MHAFLIDPFNKTIEKVTYNGNYKSIYEMLSTPVKEVDIFESVRINNKGDSIFVDEEALFFDDITKQKFFKFKGSHVAGKGLLMGLNLEDGETASPVTTFEEISKYVQFEME